ncbi:glycosyltransferase [Rhodoblastus sp. 17X3]|uniref:glycosyltransferase n=1 Tax=Rhodoblastus sp. 17X3 TaxID=3047026 RepID=UPI0024B66952|nr:glycosyltransferase [Rhodoblastus sp. 17X3]MDI9846575.1 glycosyltransferase [Rhodoblastus sp. 17X3]
MSTTVKCDAPTARAGNMQQNSAEELSRSEYSSDTNLSGESSARAITANSGPEANAPPSTQDKALPADHSVQPKFHGRFDDVADGIATGWATDAIDPTKQLVVEIWADDALIASGQTSKYRVDVAKAGFGSSNCGFAIPLPRLAIGEHKLIAKVLGSNKALNGVVNVNISKGTIQGGIDKLQGMTLDGWLTTSGNYDITVQLVADGAIIDEKQFLLPIQGHRYDLRTALPAALADGRIHWFQLRDPDSEQIIAEAVFATPIVTTPEDALQKYAAHFPSFLSPNAANRYASLEGQLELALSDASDERQGLAAQYFRQLASAHKRVKCGIAEQLKTPDEFNFPIHERPLVSIIISVQNKFSATHNCLAALLLAPNRSTFEVIVVDDGSSDLTTELEAYVTGITILRNKVSLGFVKSSNRGAQSARGEFVIMLHNDTEPCAFWIDELIHVFRSFNDVGLAGSKLVYPDGRLHEAGGIIFPNFDGANYGRNGNQHDPRYNYTRQVDYVSGVSLMLRRELWDELGGFDELLAPASHEDIDLAFRVRAKGLKTYYTPFSKVVHFEGISSGASLESGTSRFQLINEPKLSARWASTIRKLPASLDSEFVKDRGIQLRALVVDIQIPQPDKDAGSYAAVQEIRLLQSLGFKVTFLPHNMTYLGNYTEALQRSGVECLYAPFQTSVSEVVEQRAKEFDIVYITRYSVADQCVDMIRKYAPKTKIIFNNADLHFLREIRLALAAKNREALRSALETRDIELSVMRRTDITLSYSDTEAAIILSHNLDATKIARCPWVAQVDKSIPSFAERKGLAFLGNFSHPPNEEGIRYFVSEIWPELRRQVPDIELSIFGSHMPSDLRKLEAEGVQFRGYVEDVAEVYHSCRIFIAPLLSGAGIKGKVIGALAAGSPTIMTSIAGEGIAISNGSEAFIANALTEWVDSVKTLYMDEKRWMDMSDRARRFARLNFSFEAGRIKMKEALAKAGVYVD